LPLQIGCGAKTEHCLLQLNYAGAQIVSLALERLWAVRRYNGRSSATSLSGQQTVPQQGLDRGAVNEEAACTRLPGAKQTSADVVAHRLAACLKQLGRLGNRDLVRHGCKASAR
jgi:hypothetical protein